MPEFSRTVFKTIFLIQFDSAITTSYILHRSFVKSRFAGAKFILLVYYKISDRN